MIIGGWDAHGAVDAVAALSRSVDVSGESLLSPLLFAMVRAVGTKNPPRQPDLGGFACDFVGLSDLAFLTSCVSGSPGRVGVFLRIPGIGSAPSLDGIAGAVPAGAEFLAALRFLGGTGVLEFVLLLVCKLWLGGLGVGLTLRGANSAWAFS